MTQQPITIIGAGIGGLALSRSLLKHGVQTVLYERVPSTSRNSYGVTLHPSTYLPLSGILGMDEFAFKRRVAVDGAVGGSGKLKPKSLILSDQVERSSFRAHRGKLEELLREGLDVHWEHSVERVDSSSDKKLQLRMKSGQTIESSFIVGVDGPHSNTRKSLSPNTEMSILPFVAFNGKRRVQRALFDEVYAPAMDGANVVEVKLNDATLHISIIEQKADQVGVSWIYSRPSKGSTDPLYKPNRPVTGATDIPEEFFQEIDALKNLEQPFKEIFNAEKLQKERVLHWLMRAVLVPLPELLELSKKGVVLMGDSVHAEPILGGNGANEAIGDGIALAECIANGDSISSWYEKRYPKWKEDAEKSKKLIEEMHGEQKSTL
jgi:2-polyprenyl-6-methoxyphenol hydroxylase-like FAD-dependent oxidoreductase